MGCQVNFIYYSIDENLFVDENCNIIYNIYTMITPSDLFTFRNDFSHNSFPMVTGPDGICVIVLVPDGVDCFDEENIYKLKSRIKTFN